ncbi:MAG: type III secretion system export apparatus subunit SctT [Duodenibacillus sp.]|nr:type III secretion system export apparatus subunit SctT [Duodenibacillus sp.]
MLEYLFAYSLETHLFAFILGGTRLTVFAMVAPFMGNNVLNMTSRSALVAALYLVLHVPLLEAVAPLMPLTGHLVTFLGLLAKEIFLGFVLGWLAGLMFWAIESAGFFIDNQRGAGQASETDPLSGSQSSPTGSMLFQSAAYVFFATGAFLSYLGLVYGTYLIWPAGEMLPSSFFANKEAVFFFGGCVAKLALNMVLLAAPVVLACLFTDISLGLINRFASQLNVYILAMPIKSALASFLLIFYFAILMSDAPERFLAFGLDLKTLQGFLP